jgi:hypothetical protein
MEHTYKKRFPTFSPTTFNDKLIFFTKNNLQTLIDIVIIDSTYLNMVQCAVSTTTHAMIVATQKKTRSYVEHTSKDTFIPLVVKTYGCLHSRFNSFFTTCVQATIAHDLQSILVLTMLISYCWHCVSIVLQHVQAIAIFQSSLTIGKHSSSFPHITTSAPLLLANLWRTSF